MNEYIESGVLAAVGLVAYHHAGYPALMALAGATKPNTADDQTSPKTDHPTISVVMPAFNEGRFIAEKIDAIAAQDYPLDRITVLIGSDGSTDDTVRRARDAAARHPGLKVCVRDFAHNRGKLPVLNDLMELADGEIVVLSDVSAMPYGDAFSRMVRYFVNPKVGAVGGGYALPENASVGERFYWWTQKAIKVGESKIAGLIGAHGAFYAIRRDLWRPLAADTINDDFVVPMQIAADGMRTLYAPDIRVDEAETTDAKADWHRRIRIGAGNLQQIARLPQAFSPRNPGLALCFASGKGLRVACPALMAAAFPAALLQAPESTVSAAVSVGFFGAAALAALGSAAGTPGRLARYAASGHIANLWGAVRYMTGTMKGWSGRAQDNKTPGAPKASLVERTKRFVDVAGALAGLALTAPLFPLIALAVKLESPGPVFFRQVRVGRALADRTELFEMIKFRSMRADAETRSGPAWAQKNDPRVTRVGMFLRKTRLDELPQFINVLRGDMSLIGPRPERPGFCRMLDRKIPFYIERTHGIRPGITGLAQVRQGYDETLDDVRRKLMYDHSYAASIRQVRDWIRMDATIVVETLLVMAFGRGR